MNEQPYEAIEGVNLELSRCNSIARLYTVTDYGRKDLGVVQATDFDNVFHAQPGHDYTTAQLRSILLITLRLRLGPAPSQPMITL